MRLIINEWLIHDLSGDNGLMAQEESAKFLIKLAASIDQIVILEKSPWMTKAYKLMTKTGAKERILSRLLHREILLNSEKCHRVNSSDVKPIPQNLQNLIDAGQVDSDDYYLFQLYYSTNVDLIITSDIRLRDALSQINDIRIRLRNDFLKEYLA